MGTDGTGLRWSLSTHDGRVRGLREPTIKYNIYCAKSARLLDAAYQVSRCTHSSSSSRT
jgi:hypothetical protein